MTPSLSSPPDGTVRDWIDRRADDTPDGISHIFADGEEQFTWAEFRDEARAIARGLAGLGLARGESVAVCMPNSRAALCCLFGILYAGYRLTPLNLVAGPEALGYALAHCGARYAFVDAALTDLFDDACASSRARCRAIRVEGSISWPDAVIPMDPIPPQPADHALLMYTSGTTGRPKGVLHSQASLLAGGWTTMTAHALTGADRALCVLPHYHINGLCVTLMAPLVSGGSVIFCERFSNSRFWQTCATLDATWASLVPTIISHLIHSETSPDASVAGRMRFIRSASAPLAPEVQENFENRFGLPIVETMGLTETAAQILSNPLPPGLRKTGSPGIAYGNEVAIRNGEIVVRGPNVMLEYLDNPEATAESFTEDGWLRTGDLGYADDDGYVFVTGRSKELIIKGGENIAPREVDEALYQHPRVIEAAAFARDCNRYGQRVEAAVRISTGDTVSESELMEICRSRLGDFKCPDVIHFLDELPKGPSGKIQRLKLAAMTG